MDKLKEELANLNLSKQEKESLLNIHRSYVTVKQNHIFIEDKDDEVVAVGHRIVMKKTQMHVPIDKTKTLFLSNCSNVRVVLGIKINHIVLEKCKNVTIRILSGLISGIDVMNSSGIRIYAENNSIYYLSCGYSTDCSCTIKKNVINKLIISTMNCHNISLNIIHDDKIITFETNQSLFVPDLILYTFDPVSNKLLYATKNNSGEIIPKS